MTSSPLKCFLLALALSLLASACGALPQPSGDTAGAQSGPRATPRIIAQVTERSEVDGWVKYILTHDFCSGQPDPQRYTSPEMQRALQAFLLDNGSQDDVGTAGWEVFKMSDGAMMTSLPFRVQRDVKRAEFLINVKTNAVSGGNEYGEQALVRVKEGCGKPR